MEHNTDRQPVRGHVYSGIVSQDNARVHIGDAHNYVNASNHSHHNYYFCSSSTQQSIRSLAFGGHRGGNNQGELVSLKRQRLPDEDQYRNVFGKDQSLEHVLSKLGKFSKSIQDQRIGKDAKKIAGRIALIIDALKRQAGPSQDFELGDMEERHEEDDFENIENSLIVARRVDVNTGFLRTRHTELTQVVRKHDKIACEQWDISLRTSNFEFRNEDGTQTIESLSSLYLEPRSTHGGFPVTIHFGETRILSSVSFINPVVSAYRMVPYKSEVFEVVEKDDLESLLTLLAGSKATIRDCDEVGGTLLHVGRHLRRGCT
jgi:hypothetical protein